MTRGLTRGRDVVCRVAPLPQTRSFTWSGSDMASSTNPENGTVSYTYDGNHHVTQRTDAKGQKTNYTYDAYERLTQTQHIMVADRRPPTVSITSAATPPAASRR